MKNADFICTLLRSGVNRLNNERVKKRIAIACRVITDISIVEDIYEIKNNNPKKEFVFEKCFDKSR